MKKLAVGLSVALLAVGSLAGTAEARPGRGHAYGYYKNQNAYRYAAPRRGYYAYPRYSYRRSNRGAAVAAGVAGAIIGGALSAATQPRYRYYYEEPYYGYYRAPRRYYRDDYYYYDGY
jgi:hypothetical protein